MWRHGDVFLARLDSMPQGTRKLPGAVLAEGELTGHAHRIQETGAAEVHELDSERFLRVLADRATLVHEEHGPIVLEKGDYRFWIQREYSPEAIRRVVD